MDHPDLLRRFFRKVQWPPAESGCWEWTGGKTADGFGRFKIGPTQVVPAHRFIYQAMYGPIPRQRLIHQRCRNHGCVNPAHLED